MIQALRLSPPQISYGILTSVCVCVVGMTCELLSRGQFMNVGVPERSQSFSPSALEFLVAIMLSKAGDHGPINSSPRATELTNEIEDPPAMLPRFSVEKDKKPLGCGQRNALRWWRRFRSQPPARQVAGWSILMAAACLCVLATISSLRGVQVWMELYRGARLYSEMNLPADTIPILMPAYGRANYMKTVLASVAKAENADKVSRPMQAPRALRCSIFSKWKL